MPAAKLPVNMTLPGSLSETAIEKATVPGPSKGGGRAKLQALLMPRLVDPPGWEVSARSLGAKPVNCSKRVKAYGNCSINRIKQRPSGFAAPQDHIATKAHEGLHCIG